MVSKIQQTALAGNGAVDADGIKANLTAGTFDATNATGTLHTQLQLMVISL